MSEECGLSDLSAKPRKWVSISLLCVYNEVNSDIAVLSSFL